MESSLRLLTKNLDAAHSDVISRRFQPLFTEFSSKYPEPFLKIDLLNEQLKKGKLIDQQNQLHCARLCIRLS